MASLSIWGTLVALFTVAIVLAFLQPSMQLFGNSTVANNYGMTLQTALQKNVTQQMYNPINRSAFQTNSTNVSVLGFHIFDYGSTSTLSPFAFIYGAFSGFLQTTQQLGPNLSGTLASSIGIIGGGVGTFLAISSLFAFIVTMFLFRMVLVGISAWMKTNILVL